MNYLFNIFFKFQETRGWRFKTTNQISAQFFKNIWKSAISRQLNFWKLLGSKLLRRAVNQCEWNLKIVEKYQKSLNRLDHLSKNNTQRKFSIEKYVNTNVPFLSLMNFFGGVVFPLVLRIGMVPSELMSSATHLFSQFYLLPIIFDSLQNKSSQSFHQSCS